jgi:hypothetical protein
MPFNPMHRIHRVSEKVELLILAHQFDSTGPIHYFQDHNHARNFCRYLFSLTKPHPTNALTQRNIFCEKLDGVETAHGYLNDPEKVFNPFMARRFPKASAHKTLCDDGAYLGFCFLMEDRHIVTNLVTREAGTGNFETDGMFEPLGGTNEDLDLIQSMIEKAEDLTVFDDIKGQDTRCEMADRLVQRLVSDKMGGNPLLTISHRDQLSHNQTFHFHRLLAM